MGVVGASDQGVHLSTESQVEIVVFASAQSRFGSFHFLTSARSDSAHLGPQASGVKSQDSSIGNRFFEADRQRIQV
jgi:hypothetical protein